MPPVLKRQIKQPAVVKPDHLLGGTDQTFDQLGQILEKLAELLNHEPVGFLQYPIEVDPSQCLGLS